MDNTPIFSISRVFDAPRDLVFQAWTQPQHLLHWWGPKDFTVRVANLDLRPAGTFHYCLQAPKGDEMWGLWNFREVEAPERLVFTSSFSDEAAQVTRAPFSETWPLEMLSTVTFSERDGKTTLTIVGEPIIANDAERKTFEQNIKSMQGGWTGTLDTLAGYLADVQ